MIDFLNLANLTVAQLLLLLVFVCFLEAILLVYIPFKYFKPTARKLNSIIRRGKDALFLLYDDGRVFIKEVTQISKHGVLKGKRREEYFLLTVAPPKKEGNPESWVDEALRELLAKRAILEDTGSCVFFGYAGKITATTPFVAGAVELASKPSVATVQVPEGKTPVLLFDLQKLKDVIARGMGLMTAGLHAIIQDTENLVRAEMSKGRFGSLMWFVYVLMGIFVLAIVLRILGIGG